MDRHIRREGRDAELREVSESGEDDWGDSTRAIVSTTPTSAIVRQRGSDQSTITVAGEKVQVDVDLLVPSGLEVDPEAEDSRPRIRVGGRDYKVWLVDDSFQSPVGGGQRLVATRE